MLQVAMQSEGYNLKSYCWTYQQRSLKEKKELVARLKCSLYTPFVNNNNNDDNNEIKLINYFPNLPFQGQSNQKQTLWTNIMSKSPVLDQ